MKLFELKLILEDVIYEEIQKDQLISTSKALNIPEEELKVWINKTDPTPRKSFSPWLLRALKTKDIRTEDDIRVKAALNRFIQLRNAKLIEPIQDFQTLHALETKIESLAGKGAKRKGFSGVDPTTLPGVTVLEDRPDKDMTFYKVTNPDSLSKIGEGTKWCTRFSYNNSTSMAEKYIKEQGYIIDIYKDGKPFVQYDPDLGQIKDLQDLEIRDKERLDFLDLPKPEEKFGFKVLMKWHSLYPDKKQKLEPNETFENEIINRLSRYNPNDKDWVEQNKVRQAVIDYFEYSIATNTTSEKAESTILNVAKNSGMRSINPKTYYSTRWWKNNFPAENLAQKYIQKFKDGNWPEFNECFVKSDEDYENKMIQVIKSSNNFNVLEKTIELLSSYFQYFMDHFVDRNDIKAEKYTEFRNTVLKKDYSIIMGKKETFRSIKKDKKRNHLPGSDYFKRYLHSIPDEETLKKYEIIENYFNSRIPTIIDKRNTKYEEKVVNSIINSDNYYHLNNVLYQFNRYLPLIKGIRLKEFEEAIESKSWGRILDREDIENPHRHIVPGLDTIINYVKNNIKGNWPQFEASIQNLIQSSAKYYKETGLMPHNISNTIVRDIAIFSKFIKDKHPSIRTEVFESVLKSFLIRCIQELRFKLFDYVLKNVVKLYVATTRKPLDKIFGDDYARKLYLMRYSLITTMCRIAHDRDSVLEDILLHEYKRKNLSWRKIHLLESNLRNYCVFVIRGRWPEFEQLIESNYRETMDMVKNRGRLSIISQYSRYLRKGNWPKFENMLKTLDGGESYLPGMEPKDSFMARYKEELNTQASSWTQRWNTNI